MRKAELTKLANHIEREQSRGVDIRISDADADIIVLILRNYDRKPPAGPQAGEVAPWSSPDAREPGDITTALAAVQRFHDALDKAHEALREIAHLPDDADLHEATLIALRALPIIEDKPVFERHWCAWCGGTCECDEDAPDDLSDGLPHLNRNE